MTDTTAPCTGNRPGAVRSGTVGPPIPGATIRISPGGEVRVRGVGVTPGYRNPAENADAFVDDTFRTGDLGSLDERGRLTLRGRVKDIIVTAGRPSPRSPGTRRPGPWTTPASSPRSARWWCAPTKRSRAPGRCAGSASSSPT